MRCIVDDFGWAHPEPLRDTGATIAISPGEINSIPG